MDELLLHEEIARKQRTELPESQCLRRCIDRTQTFSGRFSEENHVSPSRHVLLESWCQSCCYMLQIPPRVRRVTRQIQWDPFWDGLPSVTTG